MGFTLKKDYFYKVMSFMTVVEYLSLVWLDSPFLAMHAAFL